MPKSNFGVSLGPVARRPRYIDPELPVDMLESDINQRMGELLNSVGKNDPSLRDFDYARSIADIMQMYDLPMPKPEGEGGFYTRSQYNRIYDQYPAVNQMMSPAQELAARQAFAQKMAAMQQTRPRELPPMFGARRILNDNALSRLLGYD